MGPEGSNWGQDPASQLVCEVLHLSYKIGGMYLFGYVSFVGDLRCRRLSPPQSYDSYLSLKTKYCIFVLVF